MQIRFSTGGNQYLYTVDFNNVPTNTIYKGAFLTQAVNLANYSISWYDWTLEDGNRYNSGSTSKGCLFALYNDDFTADDLLKFSLSPAISGYNFALRTDSQGKKFICIEDSSHNCLLIGAIGFRDNLAINYSGVPVEMVNITQNLTNVTSSYIQSSAEKDSTITVNLSADTGYSFSSVPTYTVDGVTTSFIASGAGYTANIVCSNDVTINASASIQQFTVTQNLTNVTSSYSGNTANYGETIYISLSKGSNYTWAGTPNYTMGGVTYNFVASGNNFTASIVVTDNIVISASANAQTNYNVYLTLSNCTANINEGSFPAGTEINITLTANEGYAFTGTGTNAPNYIMGGTRYYFTVSQDKQTATATFVLTAIARINATANLGLQIGKELTYCQLSPNINYVFEGLSYHFVLTPVSGNYEFTTVPYIDFGGWRADINFVKTPDIEEYTLDITVTSDMLNVFNIIAVCALKKADSKYGLVNLYSPTIQELQNLASARFPNVEGERIDIGKFIISVRKLYCTIPILGRDIIDMGYYYSDVESGVINQDEVTLECGEIAINEVFNNAFDYSPHSKAEIFLPLIGFQNLDVNEIMGELVSLVYKFNIITNDLVVILSTNHRGMIKTFKGKGGYDVPFIYNAYENTAKTNIDDVVLSSAGFTPFIRIITNKPYYPLNGSNDSMDIKEFGRIGDNQGYTEIQEVDFNASNKYITSVEIQEIKNLLSGGVIL